MREERKLTIYRDDSTVQVRYEKVKAFWWTAGSTVLTISLYSKSTGSEHHYVHWLREHVAWFKDEPVG